MATDWQSLDRRLRRLERAVGPGGLVAQAVGDALGKTAGDLTRRIDSLEDSQLKFMGVHQVGRSYEPGMMTVRSGSLWFCCRETRDPPGKSNDWQLAVKSGELNRDPTLR